MTEYPPCPDGKHVFSFRWNEERHDLDPIRKGDPCDCGEFLAPYDVEPQTATALNILGLADLPAAVHMAASFDDA